jgi:hypothetical protein
MALFLLPLMAAIASSHQLTPFMLLAALFILALFRQLRPRFLVPLAMVAITVGWLEYGAKSWVSQNSKSLIPTGLPWQNATHAAAGTAAAGTISSGQHIIDLGSRGLSGALGVLAVIGFWRWRHHHNATQRRAWFRIALLAAAAFPAVSNSYGGEIIFRIYLFALPFMAIAAAAAFFPHPRVGRSVLTGLVLGCTLLGLTAGYSLGNFGEESINYFTPQEVAASKWVYQTAPKGAMLLGPNSNFPWAFVHYDWYTYTFLDSVQASISRNALRSPVNTMVYLMAGRKPAPYLILTRSEEAEITMLGLWPAGEYTVFTHDLLASGKFKIVYQNSDALILQLATPKPAKAKSAHAKSAKTKTTKTKAVAG